MSPVPALVRRAAASDVVGRLLRRLSHRESTVLTYHRFSGPGATPPETLRATLAYLRRHRYPLLPLGELLDGAAAGRVAGAVAFTFDDGYLDFADVAQPIFAEFDCPVTVFVSTGPVDRQGWFWWDRVAVAMARSRVRRAQVDVHGVQIAVSWANDAERAVQYAALCETLKRVPTPVCEALVGELAAALGVGLPERPPAEYEMMTWDDVRRCERAGVTIGGHTVTHPILARCDDARARWEVAECLRRLRAECAGPVDLFAYPNGQPADFTDREVAVLQEEGVRWAVTTTPGYVRPAGAAGGRDGSATNAGRYRVPRMSDPGHALSVARVVSGADRFRGRGR